MTAIRDFMTQKPLCVKAGDPVAKARTLIRKHGYRALPVVEDGRLIGIISRSDILRVTSSRTNLTVGSLMTTRVYAASQSDDLLKTAKTMAENGVRQLPVVNSKREVVGILSALDVLKSFIATGVAPSKKRVRDVMSKSVVSCGPDDNITKVWEMMLSTGFSGLPVLEKSKVVGIITRMDLLKHGSARPHIESGKGRHMPVKKLMQIHVATATPSESIGNVAGVMVERRIIRLPVVETGMKLAGIVDIEDVIRAYVH
ncbi:MAG: CBS domain-containing protein [Candidatus Altiarchaeota archaeon]|nr:CBS domain-containing protein [Candidatus Altiarchaeota archaeon]